MAYATKTKEYRPYPRVMEKDKRREAWMRVWGIWKQKKPDPLRVMRRLRRELDRKLM